MKILGLIVSIAGAGWALVCFARRVPGYSPLMISIAGALWLVLGNLADPGGAELELLDVVAVSALATGVAISLYTILTMRRRGRG